MREGVARRHGCRWNPVWMWWCVSALWCLVCPRTPRLTSALGPVWLRVGDMMLDGVLRQMVLRPLSLSGPSPRGWVGSSLAGSWPRFIG